MLNKWYHFTRHFQTLASIQVTQPYDWTQKPIKWMGDISSHTLKAALVNQYEIFLLPPTRLSNAMQPPSPRSPKPCHRILSVTGPQEAGSLGVTGSLPFKTSPTQMWLWIPAHALLFPVCIFMMTIKCPLIEGIWIYPKWSKLWFERMSLNLNLTRLYRVFVLSFGDCCKLHGWAIKICSSLSGFKLVKLKAVYFE